jgi:hypothetical protein
VKDSTIFRTILEKNKCDKCNLTIHPNFIGNHKCDHQNCPICKSPITPSQYWFHVRSHPGHENDSPPPPSKVRLRIDETQAIPVMAIIVETTEELSHFKSNQSNPCSV